MKVYISGPISGLTEAEYTENFARAEAFVISEGYDAVNPVKVQACLAEDCEAERSTKEDGSYLHSWQCYMKHDLIAMFECDTILMIPGWQMSVGAKLELGLAMHLGYRCASLSDDYRSAISMRRIDGGWLHGGVWNA